MEQLSPQSEVQGNVVASFVDLSRVNINDLRTFATSAVFREVVATTFADMTVASAKHASAVSPADHLVSAGHASAVSPTDHLVSAGHASAISPSADVPSAKHASAVSPTDRLVSAGHSSAICQPNVPSAKFTSGIETDQA